MFKRSLVSIAMIISVLASALAPASASTQLRYGITQDEGTLNPYTYQTGYPGHNLLHLVFDALMQIDAEGVPQPWLAKSVDVSDGGRVWTVKLQENVTWHDGTPLTSDDVRFTYEYVQTPEGNHSRWSSPARAIEKLDTPDAHTIIFTLKSPTPSFNIRPLADLPIFPRHIWTGVTEPRKFENSIGSGPYKVVQIDQDKFYRLEANAEYFKGKPKVDSLFLEVIKDSNAMFTALRAGQVDAISRALQPELVAQFEGQANIKTVKGPSFTSTLLLFNMERAPYNEKDFRIAVDLAIDKKRLVDTILLGQGTVGTNGFVHPELPWANKDLKPNFDQARAKQLLDGLGMKDVDNDGFREMPDGKRLDIQLLSSSNNPLRMRAAEMITADLKAVGIRATVRAMEHATLTDQVWKDFDVAAGRNFDMAMFGWSAPVQTDPGRLFDLVHSSHAKGTINLGAYKNPVADSLGDQLGLETDPEKRYALNRQLQQVMAADVPFITLWFPEDTYAYNPRAYDGWVYTKGQGILSKISFFDSPKAAPVPAPQTPTGQPAANQPQETTATRSSGLVWFLVAAGLGVGALVFVRRKQSGGKKAA